MRKVYEATGGQPQRWGSPRANLGAVKADAAAGRENCGKTAMSFADTVLNLLSRCVSKNGPGLEDTHRGP